MSAGAVFQEALRITNRQSLPHQSQQAVFAALEAGRPGPLTFLYEAGAEAKVPRVQLLLRAAALFFNFCAANLADDLSDGDCTYLSPPFRLGPPVQFVLQNLLFTALAEAKIPHSTLGVAMQDLLIMGGGQITEIQTQRWTATIFREVGEQIAGRQWSAYLRILWSGTKLAARGATVGMHTAIAGHVAEDIRSADPRFMSLSLADKRTIIAWASASAEVLRNERLHCLDAVLSGVDPILRAALTPRGRAKKG
ncbi:MAG: hypothetical protein EXR78_02335 [Deltaproteobacteria bacterium]|nr:hypothetical protein [Deltaproteobacteria bacterium]